MSHEYSVSVAGVAGLLDPHDAFGGFEDFEAAGRQRDPGRSIQLTPEVLRHEAELQREREAKNVSSGVAWRAGLQLNAENLRMGKATPATALRHAESRPEIRAPRPRPRRPTAPPKKVCQCGRRMRPDSKRAMCRACSPKRVRVIYRYTKPCVCGAEIDRRSRHDLCSSCRGIEPARNCGFEGCPRKTTNVCGLCFEHKALAAKNRRRLAVRVKCSGEGCERLLRGGRAEGLCSKCGDKVNAKKNSAAWQRRYMERQIAKSGLRCGGCHKPIAPKAKSGLCRECFAPGMSRTTVLRAGSAEERDLDRAWQRLSLADKGAVFSAGLR